MAQCPRCQSTNVVVTEEVITRKESVYYRFWQTVVVMVMIGMAIGNFSTGIFLGLGGELLVGFLSLINAGKKTTSRTKISCITCKEKAYIELSRLIRIFSMRDGHHQNG
jgi:hypothetical protein